MTYHVYLKFVFSRTRSKCLFTASHMFVLITSLVVASGEHGYRRQQADVEPTGTFRAQRIYNSGQNTCKI